SRVMNLSVSAWTLSVSGFGLAFIAACRSEILLAALWVLIGLVMVGRFLLADGQGLEQHGLGCVHGFDIGLVRARGRQHVHHLVDHVHIGHRYIALVVGHRMLGVIYLLERRRV